MKTSDIEILGMDEVSLILGFLHWKDTLYARVNRQWSDAARIAEVPISTLYLSPWNIPELFVKNRSDGLALRWLPHALPRLQCVHCNFSLQRKTKIFKVVDGDDPFELTYIVTPTGVPDPVDISPIARFRELSDLCLQGLRLNGSYPFLFDFPALRSIDLSFTGRLRWDLEMVAGLPKLEKLRCVGNFDLSGDLKSLRVLINSLTDLCLANCENVSGSLMTLADFPKLKVISIEHTHVSGDIREIGPNDFISIEQLHLCDGIYGGEEMRAIEDAPALMLARYQMKRRNHRLFENKRWRLSSESHQYYDYEGHHSREPPFWVEFVRAGPRLGWRWTNAVYGGACVTQWFDPEPESTDESYEEYISDLKHVENDTSFYSGCQRPPTQQEHAQICRDTPLDPMLLRNVRTSQFTGWW